ncbi:MAG: hypothetical protein JKX83_06310 [Pseudomonadales bacterium]|nr:hypothetical protein [Pseudomonadales bacterium]
MAISQHARTIESAGRTDLEVLMITYFQKHPPKIPVEERKMLLQYLRDTYLADQDKFKKIATPLIEDEVIVTGTYSAFIKRTKPSTKPVAHIDTKALQSLIQKLHQSSADNNFLDVTPKKAVHKKGNQIKGGIAMPNPMEGEVLMQSHGKPDYRKDSSLLPRPELTPQASANRNKKPANLRLYEDFLKEVDTAASEVSKTRTAWIEEAIQEKLTSQRKFTPDM